MRRPVIAGNWKMHKTGGEAVGFIRALRGSVGIVRHVDIIVAPPFTALATTAHALEGSRVMLAAQDLHPEPQGAYTGSISVAMLADLGCSHVILGHSERRQLHSEDDALVNRKLRAAQEGGLIPILCLGETLEERDAEQTLTRIRAQVTGGLAGLSAEQVRSLIIAYEPIWAIGTGRTATPAQAQEVHAFIRGVLRELYGAETSAEVRVLYGGSVKPDNVDELMARPDIDGALVGGAALDAASFARIVKFHAAKGERACTPS